MQEIGDLEGLMAIALEVEREMATGEFYESLASTNANTPRERENRRNSIESRGKRNDRTCRRCGRPGHEKGECYSVKHKDGRQLTSTSNILNNTKDQNRVRVLRKGN